MTILRPFAALTLLTLLGCAAQRPVLYPPDRATHENAAVEQRDIRECQHLADANVSSPVGTDTIRETAVGGGIGAASGVVGGAIFGSPGTGAAVGAASGATASLVNRLVRMNPADPTYQAFVRTCLADRGHRVIGWQ